jgi:hypothetical protein
VIVAEPPLGNRIKHIVCADLSRGKQDVEEKIFCCLYCLFSARKSHLRRKGHRSEPCTRFKWRIPFTVRERPFIDTLFRKWHLIGVVTLKKRNHLTLTMVASTKAILKRNGPISRARHY